MPNSKRDTTIEVVLGAGGIKLFCLIGFLRALVEKRVHVNMYTGASAGSLAGLFFTNGYSPKEMLDIFLEEDLRNAAVRNPLAFLNPFNMLSGGLIDIEEFSSKLVDKYKLAPQANLRILAYNMLRREPVVFEGTDYNVVKAVGASCAVPIVMKPIFHWGGKGDASMHRAGILMDGGIHDINPHKWAKGRAIVANLGFAKELPNEWLSPMDWYFHLLEMTCSSVLDWYFKMPENDHVVIDVAPKSVAGLTFSLSERSCREMEQYAYRVTCSQLDDGIRKGLIPVKKRVPAGDT
ncbi:MAG: hypothetical protein C0469_15200 [Cyanobacteria bacterium DS2.3.42]|nr:hypothetical protein [Cyanobacteria bacterium DS2.3.42]